jgi:hypothetical protein
LLASTNEPHQCNLNSRTSTCTLFHYTMEIHNRLLK